MLGLHLNCYDWESIKAARPVMVHVPLWEGKSADAHAADLMLLRQAVGPDCIISSRIWMDDAKAHARLEADPSGFALEFATRTMEIARKLPAGVCNGWLALNEVPTRLNAQWGQFQEIFNRLMLPTPVIAYAFSVGTSPISAQEWQPLLRGLTGPNVVGICQHEYWLKLDDGNKSWLQYRVERSHNCLPDALRASAKWHITEIAFTGTTGDGLHGWRNSGGISEAEYVRQLTAYASQIRQYPFVVGAAVFAVDYPESDWGKSFGVQGSVPILQVIGQK